MQHLEQETSSDLARAMSFSLQRYWKLKEAERLSPVARYEDELMWANWNPEVPSLLQSGCPVEQEPAAKQSNPNAGHQRSRRKRK